MQLNNKFRVFGLIVGVLALGGLVGVMALTVQRAQQLQSTISRPKAYTAWPQCAKTGPYACTDYNCFNSENSKRNIEKCCPELGAGASIYNCEWPARGFCTPDQCAAAEPDNGAGCSPAGCTPGTSGCDCNTKRGHCSLYYLNTPECTATPPPPASVFSNPSPPSGSQVPSLTPTLSWSVNASGLDYQNAYITTSSQCYYEQGPVQWFDHVAFGTNRVTASPLQPNTTYYWNVYATPGNPTPSTGCQSFRTPAAPPTNTIPNCTNLTGPTTLTVGQAGTYSADYSSPQGNLGGTIDAGQNGQFVWNSANTGISGNSGHLSFVWTPTVAGTYDVFCRAWNDGIAECRGKSNYVDGPPRHACVGPTSSMTVTVTAVASCVTANCPDNQACVQPQNICLPVVCLPIPNEPCKTNTASNHTCVTGNVADGTACGAAGNTCQRGVCTPPSAECTADVQCPDTKRCNNGSCVSLICPRLPTDGCWSFNISNHACNKVNVADGTACTTAGAGSTCQNGVCTAPSCSTGQTLCGTACKNLQTDPNNCGACGTVCTTGRVCNAGVCTTTCSGATPDLCGTTCTNKQTDNNNCGACGTVCTAGRNCLSGVCTSAGHLACINKACAVVSGAGDNRDQCQQVGGTCCRSTPPLGELLIPFLIGPADLNTSVSADGTTTFGWQPHDGTCGDATTYTLFIDTASNPQTAVASCTNTTNLTCTPASGVLTPGTKYYWKVSATKGTETAYSLIRSFTTTGSNEVNACWGNQGAGTNAGRCYDCNGDGVINILDFSCFAKRWREKVQ